MRDYTAKIVETSRELTAKEKILFKDFKNAQSIAELTEGGCECAINPGGYCVVEIHNGMGRDNTDYKKYMIWDKDGNMYRTSSENLFETFKDIYETMKEEEGEWGVKFYAQDSKNYQGKQFLTCSIF